MTNTSRALAVLVLSGAFSWITAGAYAQSSTTPPTTATRPATPDQNSLSNANAPPASTTQTTGQTSPDPKVREMNQKEKDKVEREGK
jgi:cytoskeletal protein RodZ